jgi:predicted secreted Zn-dependent protease
MPISFARSLETGAISHKAKHGLGATTRKTATAEMLKVVFIWDALLSAVAKFEERHGALIPELSI